MVEATGIFEKLEKDATGTWATISGNRYKVLEYVEPFAARRRAGDEVGIVYQFDMDGTTRILTKVLAVKKEVTKSSATGRLVEGIVVDRAGNNLKVLVNGKETVYAMGPFLGQIKNTIFRGQHVKLDVNKDSFITTISLLGEILSEDKVLQKPPVHTAAEIKREQAAQTPPPQAPPAPPAVEKQETRDISTSPSPPASTRPGGVPPPGARISIDCAINLGGYESIKVGIQGDASDLPALKAYLIDTLRSMGERDVMAKASIEKYITRVLEAPPQGAAA